MPEPMPGRASILNSQRSPSRNGPSRCSSCGSPRSSRGTVDRPAPALVRHLVRDHRHLGCDHRGHHDRLRRGVFGRLAGHTFLLARPLITTLAIPLLATANPPAQRKLGKYWKKLQRMTYVIWAFVVLYVLLLDGFTPFGGADGDGDPVFHQRFYQAVAVSIPLIVLRLPPVRRWIVEQRAEGRQWLVWLAVSPLAVFYLIAMAFIVHEEFFTRLQGITMTHLFANLPPRPH